MAKEQTREPVVLLSVPTEIEAAAIVSQLRAEDIHAEPSGGTTAGFRAEAPGMVQILVNPQDVERARQVLEQGA